MEVGDKTLSIQPVVRQRLQVRWASYDLLVVLSPALATSLVVDHHTTKLALVFSGLLPHDGAAGGGGAARHGCCRQEEEKPGGRKVGQRRRG